MFYNDGVPFDENYKMTKCPICGNEEFSEKAIFCRICGSDIYNYCEGDVETDADGNEIHKNQHPCPSNARYCEICGKPTTFLKKNILVTYKDFQAANEQTATDSSSTDTTAEASADAGVIDYATNETADYSSGYTVSNETADYSSGYTANFNYQ
jgi:hypothetical protein